MRDEAVAPGLGRPGGPGVAPVAAGHAGTDAAPGSAGGAGMTGDLGRRNDRLLLLTIGGYVLLLSALMIAGGVAITPDVFAIGLGLAAVLLGRGRLFVRDWVPFIGLFLAYELMRGYADNFGAEVHVEDVLALERWLFLGALPTQVLQDWLHPATGTDPFAVAGTILYFLHFPLPIAVAFLLWLRRRRAYYDYVAALILLSMAGFATYLVLPVAPPWWAAEQGIIPGPDGAPAITYLKAEGFAALAALFGFEGSYLYSYTIYEINPNAVAAFPSLHAAYPFLAFLFARRHFGRIGWAMLGYGALVWWAIVYLADHYVVDIVGGVAYAWLAYAAVVHAPGWFRRVMDRAADPELEAIGSGGPPEDAEVMRRLRRRVVWPLVGQGAAIAVVGSAAVMAMAWGGVAGGAGTPLFLLPWMAVIGGFWRAASAVLGR